MGKDLLHLTNIQNINSILKYGILPTYVDLDHHWETFKNHNLSKRKCIYTWDGETYKNSKFIKDMIYCKLFIHPRNRFYSYTDNSLNFYDYGQKIIGKDSSFLLLKINSDNWFGNWYHIQEPGGENSCTTVIMDEKYSHDDKELYIFKEKIIEFEIIEKINVRVYKNNTLGFSFSKVKN